MMLLQFGSNMAFLPSLIHELCPAFASAVRLRSCCRELALALPDAALSVLALTQPVNSKVFLEKCAVHTGLDQARLWIRLLARPLVKTLESFVAYLVPHVRFFADEEIGSISDYIINAR